MANPGRIGQITEEIFRLDSPKIDESRKDSIRAFITTTVNGDADIHAHLIINAVLDDQRGLGVLVYILTNVRIIKIEIDSKNVMAYSPTVNSIASIQWKLLDGNRNSIGIYFQGGEIFGLTYPLTTSPITEFFQKVDLARTVTK